MLGDSIGLALETGIPLIVVCSKRVDRHQVTAMATRANVEAFALDLPSHPANPLGIPLATSSDEDLVAAGPGSVRDLSTKRNLGLVLARMLGWQRLMFLDDDIYDVTREDLDALAAGLSDHSVSVLISEEYPDNSVACHAHRLGGGRQGKFAGAGGMGVRCDRDDLAFFPNIYNDDWFFFSEEAARHRIAHVGVSQQRKYDPYEDPQRAVTEEFGDLLAEGLYARLDAHRGVPGVDIDYWTAFIESRRDFLRRVAESLARHPDRELDTGEAWKFAPLKYPYTRPRASWTGSTPRSASGSSTCGRWAWSSGGAFLPSSRTSSPSRAPSTIWASITRYLLPISGSARQTPAGRPGGPPRSSLSRWLSPPHCQTSAGI